MKILCLLGVLLLQGCGANMFLGTTKASATFPDGRAFNYENNRDLQGVDVAYDPVTGAMTVKLDKSGTPEAAIAASAAATLKALNLLEAVLMSSQPTPSRFTPATQ